jgi:acetyl-CoA synthetase
MADERAQPVDEIYQPPARVSEGAYISSMDDYWMLYDRSINDADAFWTELAHSNLDWMEPFDTVSEEDLSRGQVAWFLNGKLNVAVNCLDRHLALRGDKVAILWEGDAPGENRRITYRELYDQVSQLGNELRARGIEKGDRVAIYMGMVPELAVAMLACARIGAIHSVIFGGFSPASIADRVQDSTCKAIITQDEGLRGSRPIPLKKNVDEEAEGRPAHAGRVPPLLHGLAQDRLRPARGRHLLLRGGRGLDHRPLLHRLRAARQRRDIGDV